MNLRGYGRAPLRLPVRMRWTTPFGQKTEIAESLDASRSGLCIVAKSEHELGTCVWITFPYDETLLDGQPEVPARVVRFAPAIKKDERNGENGLSSLGHKKQNGSHFDTEEFFHHGTGLAQAWSSKSRLDKTRRRVNVTNETATLALHFENPLPTVSLQKRCIVKEERRASPRGELALPIHARPEHMPWYEEAMSIDISADGMRFLGSREYEPGHHLLVSFDYNSIAPWPTGRELLAVVVRVDPVLNSPSVAVAVCRLR